jgi:hypothetical protein
MKTGVDLLSGDPFRTTPRVKSSNTRRVKADPYMGCMRFYFNIEYHHVRRTYGC